MAKRKAQVRFVAEIGGELKRLFSVRESPKGDLLITNHTAGLKEEFEGELATIVENRYAVHPSPNSKSGAITVHKKIVFDNGCVEHNHLLTHAMRDGRFQPIYVRCVIDLSKDHHTLVPHPKDEIVTLASYDAADWILYYALWLSPLSVARRFPCGPYSLRLHWFRKFALLIPYCFIPLQSLSWGQVKDYTTSSAEFLPQEYVDKGFRAGIAQGALPPQAFRTVIHDFNSLISDVLSPSMSRIIPEQVQATSLEKPQFFSRPAIILP
jgi:hypothetical protein